MYLRVTARLHVTANYIASKVFASGVGASGIPLLHHTPGMDLPAQRRWSPQRRLQ